MILNAIKAKYKSWSDHWFLKRHGCDSWKQYYHMYDPDVNYRANEVKLYYDGYPYVYQFDRNHQVYDWDIWYNGYGVLSEWAADNCSGKVRFDALRVLPQQGISLDGSSETVWFINELGGGDYIYVAFKNSRDYTMFLLKWT